MAAAQHMTGTETGVDTTTATPEMIVAANIIATADPTRTVTEAVMSVSGSVSVTTDGLSHMTAEMAAEAPVAMTGQDSVLERCSHM